MTPPNKDSKQMIEYLQTVMELRPDTTTHDLLTDCACVFMGRKERLKLAVAVLVSWIKG